MEIKFNCTERKRLAQAIGMIVGATPNGSPSPLSLRDISPHCGESPSDSNSIFPALAPSKSATRKIRFLRWGRFPPMSLT